MVSKRKKTRPVAYRNVNPILDAANLAILGHLVGEPRIAVRELARRVGMSAPAVAERITRLREAGVIRREWIEIDSLSDAAVTALARERGVDILIDLGGYGDAARMPACANRMAPVQIKWVGMQSHSSGLAEMDWFISDRWETPDGFERYYSERLLRLPDGYVCYTPPPHAPAPPPRPSE